MTARARSPVSEAAASVGVGHGFGHAPPHFLPGLPFVYYGEELGLENGLVAADAARDPIAVRAGEHAASRDPARTPMPWRPGPGLGFTTAARVWLPDGRPPRRRYRRGAAPGSAWSDSQLSGDATRRAGQKLHVATDVTADRQRRDQREQRDPQRPSFLTCDHGYSSSLAGATLHDLGFDQATDVNGGFQAWAATGLPVARATARRTIGAAQPATNGPTVRGRAA